LVGDEQGDSVGLELANHLSQVRQGATKPVEFVGEDQVDLLAPDQRHQPV
jgi:hypothetical protein